jgi:diguanylate cyclase (GGDEF)-like protein/PAS domain S-box-containing protein
MTGGTGATPLDEVLRKQFEHHDRVLVAALGPDGHRIAVPDSVDYPGQELVPLPEQRATLCELAVAGDWLTVVEVWERAVDAGIAVGQICLHSEPDRRMNLTIIDARPEHGCWLGLLTDDTTAANAGADVLPEMLATLSRPRRATLYKNLTAVITEVDESATAMLGWEATDMVGQRSTEFMHADDHERAITNWFDLLSHLTAQRVRYRHRHRDGTWVWVEVEHTVLQADDAGEVLVEAHLTDISDEMAAHEAVRLREQLFRRLAESLPTGVAQVDRNGAVVFVNQRLLDLFGAADTAAAIDDLVPALVDHDRRALGHALERAYGHSEDAELEVEIVLADTVRRCEVKVAAVVGQDNTPSVLLCVNDITESVHQRETLRVQATVDQLTGCHNRASVTAALEAALADNPGADLAVIYIDLDNFKPVNDQLGHDAGDELLAGVGARLRAEGRASDVVGRLGGDEFLVVCRTLAEPDREARAIAERIHQALCEPVLLAAGTVNLTASIGVAIARPGIGARELVSRADEAMYVAKSNRNGPVLASPAG